MNIINIDSRNRISIHPSVLFILKLCVFKKRPNQRFLNMFEETIDNRVNHTTSMVKGYGLPSQSSGDM